MARRKNNNCCTGSIENSRFADDDVSEVRVFFVCFLFRLNIARVFLAFSDKVPNNNVVVGIATTENSTADGGVVWGWGRAMSRVNERFALSVYALNRVFCRTERLYRGTRRQSSSVAKDVVVVD